jgi:hypothetical protein
MRDETSWEAATWEGARRVQLRRALRRSVRERMEAMEALAETSEQLLRATQQIRERNIRDSQDKKQSG